MTDPGCADAGAGAPSRGRGSQDGVGAEEADLREYGQSLGVDLQRHEDLSTLVREAFHAPLPRGWTEHNDDEGRVYFFQETHNQSTWEHPMDAVYRELVGLVVQLREGEPEAPEVRKAEFIHNHLREVHQRALRSLEAWSGPYTSSEGEYYYNEALKVSTWECPVNEWEQELASRHSILCRCLLPAGLVVAADGSVVAAGAGTASSTSSPDFLQSLRLPLGLVRREGGDVPETPSTRSFHTARSAVSPRSTYRSSPRPPRARGHAASQESDDDAPANITFGTSHQPQTMASQQRA